MKKNTTAIAAFFLLALFLVLQWATERLHIVLDNTPHSILYAILVTSTLIVLGPPLYSLLTAKRWALAAARRSASDAREVARSCWCVEHAPVVSKKGVQVTFSRMSWPGAIILQARRGHFDFDKYCGLQVGDIVGFESYDETMEYAIDHTTCDYLCITSVTRHPSN